MNDTPAKIAEELDDIARTLNTSLLDNVIARLATLDSAASAEPVTVAPIVAVSREALEDAIEWSVHGDISAFDYADMVVAFRALGIEVT